jgi:F-type H+-transporting ATPase subunit b
MSDPTFWVLVGFLVFVGAAVYFKLPGMIGKALDERGVTIKAELDQARRLREEAQALFVDYQRRQREAEKEAAEIVAHAKEEAARLVREAHADLEATMTRRRSLAETKIAQAEAQAVKEVREAAIDLAIAAASSVLRQELQGDRGAATMDRAIGDLRKHLN